MAALVDSNVLIDLATVDPDWFRWSRRITEFALGEEALVINPIIFSEFSVRYQSFDEADALLDSEEFRREDLPYMAAFAASKAFLAYRRAGGTKERPLPDFFIGAHAVVRGYKIITRDPSGYRSYFPGVELITPETHPIGKFMS
jgi:predicted nucleic acid-binding protein